MKTARISVFALVAFAVFAILCWENLPIIVQKSSKNFVMVDISGNRREFELPQAFLLIFVFHCIVGMRLYLQAWAIDVNPSTNAYFAKAKTWGKKIRIYAEWVCRLSWVFLVSWLPIVYEQMAKGGHGWTDKSLAAYYFGIFSALFLSDLLLYKIVVYSLGDSEMPKEEKHGKYKILWLTYDGLLLIFSLTLWLREFPWGRYENYKVIFYFPVITFAFYVCAIQLNMWWPEVFRKKMAIETNH